MFPGLCAEFKMASSSDVLDVPFLDLAYYDVLDVPFLDLAASDVLGVPFLDLAASLSRG